MFLTKPQHVIALLASLFVSIGDAAAQQCDPCNIHCALLGGAANAACVKSGVDPIVCGQPRIVAPQDKANPSATNLAAAAPPRCTSQGICYRAGIAVKNSCLASCFICTPSTVHPDFLLISILYAPPGNASTAAFGQATSAGVTYGIGSNVSETEGTSIDISEAIGDVGFSLTLQSGSSSGGGVTDQFSAVTTATDVSNLKPGKDPLDHTQDIFLLWLNPVVTLTKSDQKTLVAAIATGDAQMYVEEVSAGQLINGIPPEKLAPHQICPTPDTCYTVPGLSVLTKDDIKMILAQDPFLSATPNQTPDPKRFIYLQSNPLENNTVAANVTQAFTVSDAQTTSTTVTQSSGDSEGVTTGLSAKAVVVGIKLSNSDSWTWTQSVSHGTSSGKTQQASVTLASTTQTCCGINNSVTCEVSIWEDMIYRTFVFLPQPETCQAALIGAASAAGAPAGAAAAPQGAPTTNLATPFVGPSLSGTVRRGGTASAGTTVVVLDATGKVLQRIVTDHSGRYFSGGIPAGPVNVRVGSQTVQTTIKTGQGVALDLDL
jgi:hypothetical protein